MQKSHKFTSDLKKMLGKYTLVPTILAFAIAMIAIAVLYGQTIYKSADRQCRQAADRLESLIAGYVREADSLTEDPALREVLAGGEANALAADLYRFVHEQDLSADFFLMNDAGECVLGSSRQLSSYLLEKPPYHHGMYYSLQNSPARTLILLNNAGTERYPSMTLSIARAVQDGGEIKGYLIFELQPSVITEYLQDGGFGELVVTNDYQTALLSSKSGYLNNYARLNAVFQGSTGIVEESGQEYYVSNVELPEEGLIIYTIVEIGRYKQAIGYTAIVSLILLAVLITANSLFTSKVVMKQGGSIDRLMDELSQMQKDGIYPVTAKVEERRADDADKAYSEIINDIRQLVEENRQEAVMRAMAEIRQLESQINPHFIFNTLEVIRCNIRMDPSAAERMLLDFSQLLRYSIDTSHQVVSLEDDLDYVESYLSIMKRRKSSEIEYAFEIHEEAEKGLVPKLTLQPIVENAVKYGAHGHETLHIRISAQREGNILEIAVADDGRGISREKLEDIRRTLESSETPPKYFGLYNIHRRIRLMYGKNGSLLIESAEGKGTMVRIRLPYQTEKHD